MVEKLVQLMADMMVGLKDQKMVEKKVVLRAAKLGSIRVGSMVN